MTRRRGNGGWFEAPFLQRVRLIPERVVAGEFPFTLPFLASGRFGIDFTRAITFVVGENGTGKSTLLEAIAGQCGFAAQGGSRDNTLDRASADPLAHALRLSWKPKVTNGYFFRAESFFALARHLDEMSPGKYGARELRAQSHGESFFGLFENRLGNNVNAVYLLDEPEAALSPSRQMAFLTMLHRWQKSCRVQAIIATHSPILLAYPEAAILSFDGDELRETSYRDTEHYRLTKAFLNDPERHVRHLLAEDDASNEEAEEGEEPTG
ncbi:MAG TPA: AAA family ATPase [Stellaceae bacterium]|nr:AAA family ATPase [Stellaceae bacterium]